MTRRASTIHEPPGDRAARTVGRFTEVDVGEAIPLRKPQEAFAVLQEVGSQEGVDPVARSFGRESPWGAERRSLGESGTGSSRRSRAFWSRFRTWKARLRESGVQATFGST